MLVKDKVAVITGGASGIGRETSLKYAREGAKVVVADFNEVGGTETVNLIKKEGGEAVFYKVDVTKYDEVEKLVEFTVDTYKTIDVMFNNAGIGGAGVVNNQDLELYHKVINVNQHGVTYGIMAASKKMIELGVKGVIINTASVFGYMASVGTFAYHATKGAVVMMTKSAALDLAPYGIRVVAIAPGFVETPIVETYKKMGIEDKLKALQMGKEYIQPEQIADVVCLLATKEARMVNGSVVMVDDGFASFKSHLG
ncbi:SDR family NAD(P)-dependent oxidoreductase [Bacillus cereus]|uniref:SDR family NAD(P)-dependent oxidoreductase n=1 Tax=Bacillus cereus TaxID=1396 RepID=UPI000B4A9BCC|nr:SDR family oxidoreductase [Bacillus cereus]